jgi:hypothetical protein
MIRNVVVHMVGEQPLLADIEALPTPQDACLVCTNLRTSAGTRPTFIDARENWFLIPLSQIRFVEIPEAAMDRARGGLGEEPEKPEEPEELELDEEFLRRIKEA